MFGLFDGPEKKEQKEMSKKIQGMFFKSLENFNDVSAQNAELFEENPKAVFDAWYEHWFDKTVETEVCNEELYYNIKMCPIERLIKPLIMLGSQNYYVDSRNHRIALQKLLEFAPLIDNDAETLNFIKEFFGGFLENGVSRIPRKI